MLITNITAMFTNISGDVTGYIVVGCCSAVFHSKINPKHTLNRWQKAAAKQRIFKNSKINSLYRVFNRPNKCHKHVQDWFPWKTTWFIHSGKSKLTIRIICSSRPNTCLVPGSLLVKWSFEHDRWRGESLPTITIKQKGLCSKSP